MADPDNKSPITAQVGVTATASASGQLKSREQSYIIFCVVGGAMFAFSLWSKIYINSHWTDFGAFSGLVLVTVAAWNGLCNRKPDLDNMPRTDLDVTADQVSVRGYTGDPRILLPQLREMILARKPLPAPEGEIGPGGPSDAKGIRKYSAAESEEKQKQLALEAKENDEALLQKIKSLNSPAENLVSES